MPWLLKSANCPPQLQPPCSTPSELAWFTNCNPSPDVPGLGTQRLLPCTRFLGSEMLETYTENWPRLNTSPKLTFMPLLGCVPMSQFLPISTNSLPPRLANTSETP